MNNLSQLLNVYFASLLFIGLRYFLLSGAAALIFPRPPSARPGLKPLLVRLEITQSLVSIYIFAGFYTLSYWMYQNGMTQVYTDLSDYSWAYAIFSFAILFIYHDTYFYWLHRLLHHPSLFKRIHRAHHLSVETTPWCSFSFSPGEAFLHGLSLPLMLAVIPIHPAVLVTFMIVDQAINVFGHTGHEPLPADFIDSQLGKVFNSPSHHLQHHQKSTCNYSLMFNFWDRVMNSNHQEYETFFRKQAATIEVYDEAS